MPSKDRRASGEYSMPMEGVIHRRTGPRKAPPKASGPLPGGLYERPVIKPKPDSSLDRAPATPSEVVMPSKDRRASGAYSIPMEGVIHRGTGPRKAPPKASGPLPGGLYERPVIKPKPNKQS